MKINPKRFHYEGNTVMETKTGEILEEFTPQLDENEMMEFKLLIKKLDEAFPYYKEQIIKKELET